MYSALFREKIGRRLAVSIGIITLSCMLLSMDGGFAGGGLAAPGGVPGLLKGSLLVLAACVCWGFENNCTRNISSKSTYEIVVLKGVFSGLGALAIALIKGETVPAVEHVAAALLLGFVAYGLSIFLYVRAQNLLGAAKTSAYYAVAPFVGAFLSFVILREELSWMYLLALSVMIAGSVLVVVDTLIRHHAHQHQHSFTHTHDGTTHTHTVIHSHEHNHFVTDDNHGHRHSQKELEQLPGAMHL